MSDLAASGISKAGCSPTANGAIPNDTSEIAALLRLSGRIGRDPLLVQASSGNTSLKANGTLWIKASGKWLANADEQEILVPVPLSECLQCFEEGTPLPARHGSSCPACLRPSIETFMHAVLHQRVAIHVHSVDTLAWAVRSDAPVHLAEKLSGLPWLWIPYVASGLHLARSIQLACSARPDADIFILGNHGLVVCGGTCDEAESVLAEVQRRLAAQPRPAIKPKISLLERVQRGSPWRLPDSEALHALGTDVISRRIVKGGVLYPCQAIFLGPEPMFLPASDKLSDIRTRIHQLDASCPFLIVEGHGILVNRNLTAAEHAVLHGFAELVRRIQPSAPVRYLTSCEVENVLSADADRYRASAENGARFIAQPQRVRPT